MWELYWMIAFCLVAALIYIPIMVELIARAIVRACLHERFTVNRRLYGKLSEIDEDGKQE